MASWVVMGRFSLVSMFCSVVVCSVVLFPDIMPVRLVVYGVVVVMELVVM